MTLHAQLLKKAQHHGAALAEADRQARLARADYHTAVRRLHLGGGSLREIAQALGLSHQRVQQIVDGAGGTWWQRVWRSRTHHKRDAVCTFCDRPPSEVEKLIAGPNVFICDRCVALAENALSGSDANQARSGPLTHVTTGAGRCSFCGKRRSAERSLVAGPAARVCRECLGVCRQILDDRAA